METKGMGLIIEIYRNAAEERDHSSNLPSDRHSRIFISNISGPFERRADMPAFKLVAHPHYPTAPILEPEEGKPDGFRGPMAGGNYAGSSDTRWTSAVRAITGIIGCDLVPIHDHFEEVQ